MKKVKAPLTYDPGKGRPKEHLAYLNYQEMQALKRINGNNQERGPKGLPSFPPADAIGSSSKASSSKSSGSKASKSTGSYTGGGKMGKSSSQAGAQKASQQGSNLGAQKSSSQGSKSPSGKPSAGAAKASQAAEQRAQKAGTQKASAPKATAAKVPSSGIKSLNVGPMGTPVSVKTGGTKIKGAIKSVQQPVNYTSAPRYRQPQAERMANPTAVPTAERSVYERMTAADAKKSMQAALDARIDRANQARQAEIARAGVFGAPSYTGTYNPKTGKYDARPTANTIPAVKAPINKYEALRAYKGPYGPEMYSALGSPVEQAMLTGKPLAEAPRPQPIAMDPSIRGRLEEANKNYRTVQSGPYVSKVYSDPDIKGRTIGDTISDYAGSAYDTVAGGIRSLIGAPSQPVQYGPSDVRKAIESMQYQGPAPGVEDGTIGDALSDYAGRAYDAVADTVKSIGASLPPNVFSPRAPSTFTDKIGPRLNYSAPIGPQRPVQGQAVYKTPQPPAEAMYGAPYSRLGLPNERMLYNTSPATLERMEKVFNKTPEISPEGYGYAVDQQRMADEIRALMERDVETFEEPNAPSYPFSNFASESLPPGYRDRYIKSPGAKTIQPMGATVVPEEKILSVEDVPPPAMANYPRVPTTENLLPFQERAYDVPYPTDENGVPIQNVSEADLAKIRARRRGEEYVQTPQEKQAAFAGKVVSGVVTKDIPFAGKFFNVEENIADYQSRPSWEKDYIKERAAASGGVGNIGSGRSSNERPTTGGIGNLPTATPTTPSTETTTSSGTRPYIYYQWDLGLNVPSQSDPNYTQYQKYLSDRAARRAALGMA